VQPLNHAKGQWSFPGQNLIHPILATNNRYQIFDTKTLLLHSEFDGLHRIWETDWIVVSFVSLNERYKNIKAIALGRVSLSRHKTFDFF